MGMSAGGDEDVVLETEPIRHLRKAREKTDVAEIYGPPRVTEDAKKWGRKAGEAMNLITEWDSRRRSPRQGMAVCEGS